jgi:hypothetical protein
VYPPAARPLSSIVTERFRPAPAPALHREAAAPSPRAREQISAYARALTRCCLARGAQIVLGRRTGWHRQVVTVGEPAPLVPEVVDLVLPSYCLVVPVERMPNAAVRAAARTWETDRLLLAPAFFGHEVLAVGLVPVPAGVHPDLAEADAAGDRLAAALTTHQLGFTSDEDRSASDDGSGDTSRREGVSPDRSR